ncbi:hypothetical protein IWW50_006765, partial [Coemansia erecta]
MRRLQKNIAKDMARATEVDHIPPPIETKSGRFVYYLKNGTSGTKLYCRRVADGFGSEQILIDSEDLAARYGCELKNMLISDDHSCIGCLVSNSDGLHSGSESSSLLLFSLKECGAVK